MAPGFLENDLSETTSLDGEWSFQLADQPPRRITVPSAWEATQADKVTEGPARYWRTFSLDALPRGTLLLECDAVSFASMVRVNGHQAGGHTGLWTRFQIDITPFVRLGLNEIEIEVWKPGAGRYKLRESVAGFLPDVCNTFGGIWQSLRLRILSGSAIADLRVHADARGVVRVRGRVIAGVAAAGRVRLDELGVSAPFVIKPDGAFELTLTCREHTAWSMSFPQLHVLSVELFDAGDVLVARVSRRIGFRSVRARGDVTLLNGRPVHIRGVLSWGWDQERLCPSLPRPEVLAAFSRARQLGFNLFKLCLFVPDEALFDAADESGMLLWLELPLWLPDLTPAARELTLREYAGILSRVHHHPSIAIISLGCELDAGADAKFLSQLRALVRRFAPNVLICDNSGSSEAYAGATQSVGDFYDYHFYADVHEFRPLVQHFDRPYQPALPWIYGEFCDADTQRDWSRLEPQPFWLTDPVTMQRDELIWVREHVQRLRDAGVADGGAELTRLARAQATEVRKFIFEQTRLERATGGYVITGWQDTPIATSGVVDDFGELKFSPAEWRSFNADRVLVIDRERRRKWTHGGDRPVRRDPFTWWSDEPIEVHIAVSNGGARISRGRLHWRLMHQDGRLIAERDAAVGTIEAAAVVELAVVVQVIEPAVLALPEVIRLEVSLASDEFLIAANTWELLVVPRAAVRDMREPGLVTTCLDELDLDAVCAGRRVLVWQTAFDERFLFRCPFWREAIQVVQLRKISAYANLAWYGISTDMAINPVRLAEHLNVGTAALLPRWRRFDARAMTWADYILDIPIGDGLVRLTTLRFAGGLGDQPDSFATNPMGAWLLTHLHDTLVDGRQAVA